MTKRIHPFRCVRDNLLLLLVVLSFPCCDLVVGRSASENQTSPACQLLKDPLAPHLHHASAEGIYVKLFHRAKMTAHLKGQGVRPVAMDFISCGKVLQFHREHGSVLLLAIMGLYLSFSGYMDAR